jgi:type IV secretion system protein VirD4
MDELAVMDGNKCIVRLRGVRPFLSEKYDYTSHPKFYLTADFDEKNWLDIEKYLKKRDNLILKADEKYEFIDLTEEKGSLATS